MTGVTSLRMSARLAAITSTLVCAAATRRGRPVSGGGPVPRYRGRLRPRNQRRARARTARPGFRRCAPGAGRRPHPDHIRCQLSRQLRLPGRRRRGRRRHQPHLGDGGFLPVDPDRPRRLFTGRCGGRHARRHTAARQQNRRGRVGAAAAGQPGTQCCRGGGVRKPRNEVRESGDVVGLRRQGDRPLQGRRSDLLSTVGTPSLTAIT